MTRDIDGAGLRRDVTIAVLQMEPRPGDVAANLAHIATAARAAASFGATLLVAPEMAVTGYAIWDDIPRLAETRDGAIVGGLSDLARRQGLTIVAGFPERDGAVVYNSAVAALPDGATHLYRKCHLYSPHETAAFKAGGDPSRLFEIGGLKAALLICYDVEFPELARALALAGAELLLVPTALPKGGTSARVSRSMVPSRALENRVFVAYAGLCGCENGLSYQGGSVIVGRDGEDLARAGIGSALLVSRLDTSIAGEPYLSDRRPDLYRLG
ncbi:MAG TPA: nitrilase-related carbon-nitrogen hydrolase [Lichenihabitans sp.]|jgi:predicted amidohydrolase|nr:nitrilase-related carbon-nitrogen hydrolase [Lichenihabitans sp.]